MISLMMPSTPGSVAAINSTMRASAPLHASFPSHNLKFSTYNQLVATSKRLAKPIAGPGDSMNRCFPRFGTMPSTNANPTLLSSSSTLVSSATRKFSTCHMFLINKVEYDLLRLNQDAHRAYRDRMALSRLKSLYHSPNDPGVRQRLAEKSRRYHERRHASEGTYRQIQMLRLWMHYYSWIRDTLPWKSHQPLLFDKRVEHYCDGCRLARRGGLRLWWKSKLAMSTSAPGGEQTDSYLCFGCYTSTREWSAVMPQGYEDVESLEGFIARKQQLDGVVAQSDVSMDDFFRRSKRIRSWCNHDWVRRLPWPTHQPHFFEQKAELKCKNCEWGQHRLMKIWWKIPTGEYVCHHCYTKPDWTEIMPKGYEDIRFLKDMVARKKQLDHLASGHATTLSGTPSSDHHCDGPKASQSTPSRPAVRNSVSLSPSSLRRFSSTVIPLITKEQYAELRKDPERLEQYRAERRGPSKKRYHGLSPEVRKRRFDKWNRYIKQRLQDDIEFRNQIREAQKQYDAAHPMNRKLRAWCNSYAWLREGALWKSYRPLVFTEKTQFHCDGCGFVPLNGLKFWWTNAESRYLCPSCYYSSRDWSDVMPKGYEDVQSAKELLARKEQLEKSHDTGTNPVVPAASSPLHSTPSRPGTKRASSITSISSRTFSLTSAINRMTKAEYAELRSNPETYRAFLDKAAAYNMKRHDENAEFRENMRKYRRRHHKSKMNDPLYRSQQLIRDLLMQYPWSRTGLPWKLYRPVVTSEPVNHYCSGCKVTKRRGVKLWWHQALAGSDVFLCHGCIFSTEDWTRAMPEGYEDVKTINEIIARKKQLVGLDEGESMSKSELYTKPERVREWTRRLDWFHQLPWKSHRPFVTENGTEDHCARCTYSRYRALKLWWRSADETICNSCYTKGEWKDIMPQGYEDVRTSKEFRARKEELEKQEFKR